MQLYDLSFRSPATKEWVFQLRAPLHVIKLHLALHADACRRIERETKDGSDTPCVLTIENRPGRVGPGDYLVDLARIPLQPDDGEPEPAIYSAWR